MSLYSQKLAAQALLECNNQDSMVVVPMMERHNEHDDNVNDGMNVPNKSVQQVQMFKRNDRDGLSAFTGVSDRTDSGLPETSTMRKSQSMLAIHS